VSYTLDLSRVRRDLRSLDEEARKRVFRALSRLEADPRTAGAEKLSGRRGLWRIRVGDYRVVYAIVDESLVVLVLKIGHRREVYR